jgi:Dolichyl-phosphate-mannose-protein mannosyltransferase
MRPTADPVDASLSSPAATTAPASSSPARRLRLTRGPLLVLVLAVVAVAVHVPSLKNRPLNSDEAYAATQAQVLNRGGRLYVDTVDRKPPVVPYLYAAAFRVTGTDDLLALRILAVVADVVTALLLAAEARRRLQRDQAGLIAGLLFLGGSAAFYATDFQTANFEVFMLPLMVAGFTLAARNRPLAGGAALGIATLTKQTAAATLLPVAFLAWRDGTGSRTRRLATLAVGFAAPIVVAAVALDEPAFLHWVFTGNGGYLSTGGALGFIVHRALIQTLWFILANIALVTLAVLASRRWRTDLDLWLWVAAGALAVATGLRFFGHYYLQLLPPLALLATRPLVGASRRALAAAAIAVAVPIAFFAHQEIGRPPSRTEQVATALTRYVQRTVPPDGRILVWGHLPEVYWQSARPPATRFATTEFLTGESGGRPPSVAGMKYATPGAWADFEADLAAHPPELVLDLAPANIRGGHSEAIPRFPRFATYLARHYRPVGTLDGVVAYRRR